MNQRRSNTSTDIGLGSTAEHQALVHDVLIYLGCRPGFRLWKNATGRARSFDGNRIISYGLKGSPDIIGVGPGGQFIGIEVKTGNSKSTPEQATFAKVLNAMGAKVFVVSSLEDIVEVLKNV